MAYTVAQYSADGRPTGGSAWGLSVSPVVKSIIIINVVVFLLQTLVTRPYNRSDLESHSGNSESQADGKAGDQAEANRKKDEAIAKDLKQLEGVRISPVTEWFELDPDTTLKKGQVWRLITSAFCHSRTNIMHIVFNMLFLWWFGTRVEYMYGSREFLLFYLATEICASFAYLALAAFTDSHASAIGASGGVMGVMMLYTMHFPYERYWLFGFIPLPLWLILTLYVIWDLHPVLLILAGERIATCTAHAAHLGGLAFGYIYWKFGMRLEGMLSFNWKSSGRVKPKSNERSTVTRRLELD